jgi:predicted RNase H-like nuclease (RuvC/YqgF family)
MGDVLQFITRSTAELAAILAEHKEWGLVAVLLVLLVAKSIMHARSIRDLLSRAEKSDKRWREENTRKEAHISDLLERRHEQFVNVVESVTDAIAQSHDKFSDLEEAVEALELCVHNMDARCDRRQSDSRLEGFQSTKALGDDMTSKLHDLSSKLEVLSSEVRSLARLHESRRSDGETA